MRLLLTMVISVSLGAASAADAPKANYDEALVTPYTLPASLVCNDGTSVTTTQQWVTKRRPEVLELFRANVYGRTPVTSDPLKFEVIENKENAIAGKATRKLIHVSLENRPQWKGMDVLLYLPKEATKPVPVFIGLSFFGNHAVTMETDLAISTRWMRTVKDRGIADNRATSASRGVESSRWPLDRIIGRGYGLATAYYGDMEPDHSEGWKDGIRAALGPDGVHHVHKPDDWAAVGAWAWGLSRILDYCETDPALDAKRAAVIGHSRLGKTALWCGAQDQRFAIVISNDSGETGAALARRNFGETIRIITTPNPHWFASAYSTYVDRADALPVDQHMLIALQAPRPVYIASASEDKWADPRGEFLSGVHAADVYQLFGKIGLGTEEYPEPDKPIGDFVGYHVRTGKHDITAYDWEQYLDFADRHFAGTSVFEQSATDRTK